MGKVHFAFCIHNHQPIGNFEHIFEEAYQKSYKPFLETLERHPSLKVNLHYSGCLLEWLQAKHPKFLNRIAKIVRQGRCELLGGGFYEPILPMIPAEDARGQLDLMNSYLRKNFGVIPKGVWLAERVWEPNLPSILASSGLEYTALDDTHFLSAGIREEDLVGYFITEDQAKPFAVFPISMKLRYTVPFRVPEETIDYFRSFSQRGSEAVLTLADDGEKFGLWPGTYKWVYEEGWLERFLGSLEENSDWLDTITFSDCLSNFPPSSKVYLPTASYEEMTHWALPADTGQNLENVIKALKDGNLYEGYRPFLRGGYFRNFLAKYPEANHLHKKMLYISSRLKALKDKKDFNLARIFLYRGQCNCSYWHGVFGGLYLPHLRNATYDNLLRCETLIDKSTRTSLKLEEVDFDADRLNELYLTTGSINLIVDPDEGGVIKEIDYLKKPVNITCVLSRRKESYHRSLVERSKSSAHQIGQKSIHEIERPAPKGVEEYLFYDGYTHWSLIDHILSTESSSDDFKYGRIKWLRPLFDKPYDIKKDVSGRQIRIFLTRKENFSYNNSQFSLTIEKEIAIFKNKSEIQFGYLLKNAGEIRLDFIFASEFSLGLPGNERIATSDRFKIRDEARKFSVNFSSDKKLNWWQVPLLTVSQSEREFDLIQQGVIILPNLKLSLGEGEELGFSINLELK